MSKWTVVYHDDEKDESKIAKVDGDMHLDALLDPDGQYRVMAVMPEEEPPEPNFS